MPSTFDPLWSNNTMRNERPMTQILPHSPRASWLASSVSWLT